MRVDKWYGPVSRAFLHESDLLLQTLATLRKKSRSLMVFAGMLRYRLSPDVYSYLARLDVEVAL
jgi:hypothetical protein